LVPPSVVGTIITRTVAFMIGDPSFLLKSTARKSSVGTVKSEDRPTRSKAPSQSVKKNSLLFLIGPPILPPSRLRILLGFFVTPARFSSHQKLRNALSEWKPKVLPWNWFVPDLVVTVTAAPPVIPCSASKLF